jgi:hypothetical protein
MTQAFDPADFCAALLDPHKALPEGIAADHGVAAAERFAIYQNNVLQSLVAALETRFPAVRACVGEDFFAAMARSFARETPPASPVMAIYGEDFPAFLSGFAPCAELPYLADLARLEAARTRAYHAEDAEPLAPEDFAALATADLGELRMKLHPSLFCLSSEHPVATIFAMNAGTIPLAEIEDWRGEDVCVVRPDATVDVHTLPQGGAIFLKTLAEGATLALAAEAVTATEPAFDLSVALACLIRFGLVTEIIGQTDIRS